MEEANTRTDLTEAALRAALSRRRFLRGSAVGAVSVAAATIAACAPAPPAAWLYRSPTPGASGLLPTATPIATPSMNHGTPAPTGAPTEDMDALAKAVVDRFLAGETAGKTGNQPLPPRLDGGAWAFHCHILPHAEGPKGMFGMVNALIVQAA